MKKKGGKKREKKTKPKRPVDRCISSPGSEAGFSLIKSIYACGVWVRSDSGQTLGPKKTSTAVYLSSIKKKTCHQAENYTVLQTGTSSLDSFAD